MSESGARGVHDELARHMIVLVVVLGLERFHVEVQRCRGEWE
jgi:hypothetical protein